MLSIEAKKLLDRFDSTWDEQAADRLERFLAGLDASEHPEMLFELVTIDLEKRFRLGLDRKQIDEQLETYRSRYPQLAANTPLGKEIDQHLQALQLQAEEPASDPTLLESAGATRMGRTEVSVAGYRLPCAFGDFTLLRAIGRGGMGVVYAAEQQSPRRIVAIKVLSGRIMLDAEAASRFERETELIASINNPGVVPVLESGCVDDHRYYTMPYYRHGTLRSRIQSGNLSTRQSVEILLAVTRSLSAVHALQIVHRDLKPGNILFSEDESPLIADFGLSRHIDHSRSISRTGEIYGTPGYIAPERIEAKSKQIDDFVGDIYSLGAILYDMLCGRPPFRGETGWETLMQATSDSPVPPSRLNPKVDHDLNAVCMKCLERLPTERYKDCAALIGDLENYLAGRPVTAKSPNLFVRGKRFAKRHPAKAGLIASTLALLLIAWLAGFLLLKLSDQRRELAVQNLLRRNESYVTNLANAALSMTDRSMGWRATTLAALRNAAGLRIPGRDASRLRSMVASSTVMHDLEPLATLAEGMWCDAVAFNRDGHYLAVGQNKDEDGFKVLIYRTDDLTAAPYELWIDCKAENDRRRSENQPKAEDGARAICFSLDGSQLAVGTRHGRVHVYRWNGDQAELLESHDPDPGVEVWRLHFSFDGRVLWTVSNADRLRVIRDGTVERFSALGDTRVADLIASPTEDAVFLRLLNDEVLCFDGDQQTPRWRLSNLNRARDLSLSHDGRFLAISFDWNQRLTVVETQRGLKRTTITSNVTDAEHAFASHCFGEGDDWLLSASEDRTITLWDVAQGRAVSSYIVTERGGRPRITAARTQPLIAVAEHLKVTVYRIAGAEALETTCHRPAIIRNLVGESTGERLAFVSSNVSTNLDEEFMEHGVCRVDRDQPMMEHQAFAATRLAYPETSPLAFRPDGTSLLAADYLHRPTIIPFGNVPPAPPDPLARDEGTWIAASEVVQIYPDAPSHAADSTSATAAVDQAPITTGQRFVFQVPKLPDSEFDGDDPFESHREVYLVGTLVCDTPSLSVRVKSRSLFSVTRHSILDTMISDQVAIYVGVHSMRTPRKQLEIELEFDHPVQGFSLEAVGLQHVPLSKTFKDALQAKPFAKVSEWIVHPSDGSVWSVAEEENLVVADYPSWNLLHLWRNESVSSQSGRGTLSPLLATRDSLIAGTTFGEVFVFDANDPSRVHSSVPLTNRVRGMCEIPSKPQVAGQPEASRPSQDAPPARIAIGSSDGQIQVLDLPSGKPSQTISVNRWSIDALCFDERRGWLYAGSEDGTISAFRLVKDQLEPYFTIQLKIGHVQKLVYLPEADCLAVLIKNETAIRLIRPEIIRQTLQELDLL